jgi:hypothetical protein
MELEARGLADPTRRELGNKVGYKMAIISLLRPIPTNFVLSLMPAQIRTYKESLTGVTADLGKAKAKFSRSALMAGAAGARSPTDFDKSL